MAQQSFAREIIILLAKLIICILFLISGFLLINRFARSALSRQNLLTLYGLFIVSIVILYIVRLFIFADTHIQF